MMTACKVCVTWWCWESDACDGGDLLSLPGRPMMGDIHVPLALAALSAYAGKTNTLAINITLNHATKELVHASLCVACKSSVDYMTSAAIVSAHVPLLRRHRRMQKTRIRSSTMSRSVPSTAPTITPASPETTRHPSAAVSA